MVDLMKISNSSFDELDKNQRLDDGVTCCADFKGSVVSLVQNAESIAEIVFDLALGLNSNLIFRSNLTILISVLLFLSSYCGL